MGKGLSGISPLHLIFHRTLKCIESNTWATLFSFHLKFQSWQRLKILMALSMTNRC